MLLQSLAVGLLISQASAHGVHPRANPLGKQLTNTIPTLGGPTLFYNGTGPVPGIDTLSPKPAPLPALSNAEIANAVIKEVVAIGNGKSDDDDCSICISSVELLHVASLFLSQDTITDVLVGVCQQLNLTSIVEPDTCETYFSKTGGLGPYFAQFLQKMSLDTGDMQAFCYFEFSVCDFPPIIAIDESDWFTPKPANKTTVPTPCGETYDVLHFSDWHMDPRYDPGSEANCSGALCCRFNSANTELGTTSFDPSVPASRFGDFLCDTPADLGLSAFSSMRQNVNFSAVPFSIFTGDIVSHDQIGWESRALIEYEERIGYETFAAQLGDIPVYATLGNHDTYPSAFNTPNTFRNDSQADEFAWNYALVSSLWQEEGWVDNATAQYASTHYGAYATNTKDGLKIISINSDFWYTPNLLNYYNYTNPDKSGILRFLADELLAAEAADQRVWIIGHVPSGGSSAIANPSVLFHSIVARFSPATIAGIFFGHTHKDEKQLFYDFASSNSTVRQNYTDLDYEEPLSVAWVGPSIVPLTDYNAGWSVYQIDKKTFDVMNAQVYFANISNTLEWHPEPQWEFEYDARSTYDSNGTWPKQAPLNATFWHQVTERMAFNDALVQLYNLLETKSSDRTPRCEGDCLAESICEIRSSNAATYHLCTTEY